MESVLTTIREELTQNLKKHLNQLLPQHQMEVVYHYAVFPPGKLLRPLLVKAIWSDLSGNDFRRPWGKDCPHSLLASSIELHHAYTLIHDDLPCMDNDDVRRNKASTHKAYGEWMALLAGDGLLNASYGLLANLPSKALKRLLKLYALELGPSGLIHGQVLDMLTQQTKKPEFKDLLQIHALKTANLMKVAMVGSFLLIPKEFRKKIEAKELIKLSYHLGIHFQLLDDLQDLKEKRGHEEEINPFVFYPKKSLHQLTHSLSEVLRIIKHLELTSLHEIMQEYWVKNREWIIKNRGSFRLDLSPLCQLLSGELE